MSGHDERNCGFNCRDNPAAERAPSPVPATSDDQPEPICTCLIPVAWMERCPKHGFIPGSAAEREAPRTETPRLEEVTSAENHESRYPRKRWRAGRTLGRTLYLDGEVVGMVDSRELASSIVDAMNAARLPDETAIPGVKVDGAAWDAAMHHSIDDNGNPDYQRGFLAGYTAAVGASRYRLGESSDRGCCESAYFAGKDQALKDLAGQRRPTATARCEAETTIRDDEHMTYRCLLPAGHDDAHQSGATVEWTDETTRFPPEPRSLDEAFMRAVAGYVDEWRKGDDAWHAAGHIGSLVRDQDKEQRGESPTAGRERQLLRAARDLFMSNRISPSRLDALRVAVNLYAEPMATPCASYEQTSAPRTAHKGPMGDGEPPEPDADPDEGASVSSPPEPVPGGRSLEPEGGASPPTDRTNRGSDSPDGCPVHSSCDPIDDADLAKHAYETYRAEMHGAYPEEYGPVATMPYSALLPRERQVWRVVAHAIRNRMAKAIPPKGQRT